MGFRTSHKPAETEEENPYLISISDLMSGLLVVFILATSALVLQLTSMKKKAVSEMSELQKAEKIRVEILNEVKNELKSKNITVEIDENESVIHIDANTLSFDQDKDNIPLDDNSRRTVAEIGNVLNAVITKNNRVELLNTIFIEGHTDSYTSRREKGNWGLSTFRAISVWNFWNEVLQIETPFSEMKNSQGQALFSVSGYAETRRVTLDESSAEQCRKNRRIDIRITVRNPTVKEYQDVIKKAYDAKTVGTAK